VAVGASRERAPITIAALAAVTAAAWLALVAVGGGMDMRAAPFLGGWTVMMTAMMLPSVAPLVLVHRRAGRGTELLCTGYLVVWAATGVLAYAAARAFDPMMISSALAGGILIGAGLYQLTPLKAVCLRRCRSPFDFLMQRWRRGRLGALRLGVEHAAYCVGCCWGLMAVLVFTAAMSLVWAAAFAFAVFAEKVLPRGEMTARVLALALVVAGVVTVIGGSG
jgi:predicted metal-binding membrane protein